MLENTFPEIPGPGIQISRGFTASIAVTAMAINAHVLVNRFSQSLLVRTRMMVR